MLAIKNHSYTVRVVAAKEKATKTQGSPLEE